MTSATSAWSSLFQNDLPTNRSYTEEAIDNDLLTPEQVIEKAQSSAGLLVEMVVALSKEDGATFQSLESNDLLMAMHLECQEMSDYLDERIWHDTNDNDGPGTSNAHAMQRIKDEEAQIAALINCNEHVQAALKRYGELRDCLRAKELGEEEEALSRAYAASNQISHHRDDIEYDHGYNYNYGDNFEYNDYDYDKDADADANAGEDDYIRNGISIAGHDARQHHLRKSEQPLVWKLDPREDFKANKMKNKKHMDKAERQRMENERMLERRQPKASHEQQQQQEQEQLEGDSDDDQQPLEEVAAAAATLETMTLDDVVDKDTTVDGAAEDVTPISAPELMSVSEKGHLHGGKDILEKKSADTPAASPEMEGLRVIEEEKDVENKDVKVVEDDNEGILSDDSWEEIPRQIDMVTVSSSTSSSSSSFLITNGSMPTSPSPGMRGL
ncbi:hypothetical protein BG011_007801 [Mortierella polycephala]|uniref:Uncharacterized protein n=1 Tax=Mortierella polycephala TaxID=41804 RepID=A0A9P6PQ91_9FUNG|nr:hypothetical protein BG011_007801 [Mortierella polycephala]